VQIAAAGPAITVGGTGPSDAVWVKSPSWQSYAQRMSDARVAAMNAAKSKNLSALVKANGHLVESCVGCYKEFKPDLPTEGSSTATWTDTLPVVCGHIDDDAKVAQAPEQMLSEAWCCGYRKVDTAADQALAARGVRRDKPAWSRE
jgi:hypothetical protein